MNKQVTPGTFHLRALTVEDFVKYYWPDRYQGWGRRIYWASEDGVITSSADELLTNDHRTLGRLPDGLRIVSEEWDGPQVVVSTNERLGKSFTLSRHASVQINGKLITTTTNKE